MPRTYATKTGGGWGGGSNKPFQDHRDPKPLFKETVPKRAAPGCKLHIEQSTIFTACVGIDFKFLSSQYGTIPWTRVKKSLRVCSGQCLSLVMTTSSSTTPAPTTTAWTARQAR